MIKLTGRTVKTEIVGAPKDIRAMRCTKCGKNDIPLFTERNT